tara:strand:- start:8630 stop:9454 length:825 start_codon:yes stop_codon:yes gene_type:complete
MEINKKNIKEKIAILGDEQPWNHNISLPGEIETAPGKQTSHGKNLVKWGRIEPILNLISLKGKTALDLGCNEGFFSIKLAEKGAKVLGADIDHLRIKKAKWIQSILKFENPTFKVIDIYSKEFESIDKKFDFCLCMGFIHRIPDPYTAIKAISAKTDTILFEWKALKEGPHDESFAFFSQKDIDHEDYYGTEYWLCSYTSVETILKRLGFKYFYRLDDTRNRNKRAILVASKVNNEIFSHPSVIHHRGRISTFLTHTKRYLKSIYKIFSGELNS